MKLVHKIFAANLLVTFFLFFLIMVCLRVYTARQIKSFINAQELAGLDRVAAEAGRRFGENLGWKGFETSTERLADMIRWAFITPPPSHMPPPAEGRPGSEALPFSPKPPAPFDPVHRIALFDHDKTHLAGPALAAKDLILRPVTVRNKTVGWLGLSPLQKIPRPMDRGGFGQRLNAFYLAAFLIFMMTGLASFFLSRLLLRPVKKLAAGTRALAGFDFDARIPVRSGDELGQLARDFNAMADTIRTYGDMQKQWVLDISHELRTPLSVLKGEAEAMLDGVRPADANGVRSLYSEIRTLETLVRDLHYLSQEDARSLEMKREPVYPVSVLRAVLGRFENRLAQTGIRVENRLAPERFRIRGDADRLVQLFSNIFENSLKYTEKPGRLTLRQEQGNSDLKIIVEDSGPGVPEKAVDRIFDRLYRGDRARTGENRGSGLGLSVCKTIVRAHKGEIWAANIPGRGLRLTIRLPLEEDA